MQPDEYRTFTQYVRAHTLHIDIWDADSLLLIGSTSLSMKVGDTIKHLAYDLFIQLVL